MARGASKVTAVYSPLYGTRQALQRPNMEAKVLERAHIEDLRAKIDRSAVVIDMSLPLFDEYISEVYLDLERQLETRGELSDESIFDALSSGSWRVMETYGEYGETLAIDIVANVVCAVAGEFRDHPDSNVLDDPKRLFEVLQENWEGSDFMGDSDVSNVLAPEYNEAVQLWLALW